MAEINREQLLNCALCPNMCRSECPAAQTLGKEAVAPAGKARLAHLLLEGHLEWSAAALEALAACSGCRGCSLYCPFPELDLPEELLGLREEACRRGLEHPGLREARENLRRHGSPYGPQPPLPDPGTDGGPAEVLFFPGCTAPARNPGSVEAAERLLREAGVSFQRAAAGCCGYPALAWGRPEEGREAAVGLAEAVSRGGTARLVTGCPECYLTFTRRYPSWGVSLSIPVHDATRYFLALVEEGRLNPQPPAGVRSFAYHDPCLWARVEERTAEPRRLLGLIPGITPLEAAPGGGGTRCCGGGQVLALADPLLAEGIARRRLAELPPGAAVVTDCPFCRESLHAAGAEVVELVELLARACCREKGERR